MIRYILLSKGNSSSQFILVRINLKYCDTSSNSNPVSYWVTWQTNRDLCTRTGQTVFTIFCFHKMFKITKVVPQCFMLPIEHYWWPIPGKVKLLLISGKKSPSLLDHISRFLSHQFVTWYLRSISKTKIVKLFCPCMSEHMIYIKNVTNVTWTLHQNVTNVTKQNIASKEILMIEFHTKYMKLFVNMLSVICVLLNTKFYNTSENIYFEVIWSRTIVSCKVTNVTNRYMEFNLDLDEEFNF